MTVAVIIDTHLDYLGAEEYLREKYPNARFKKVFSIRDAEGAFFDALEVFSTMSHKGELIEYVKQYCMVTFENFKKSASIAFIPNADKLAFEIEKGIARDGMRPYLVQIKSPHLKASLNNRCHLSDELMRDEKAKKFVEEDFIRQCYDQAVEESMIIGSQSFFQTILKQ